MGSKELEELFIEDLDNLSDYSGDGADDSEYVISSIEKMEMILKSKNNIDFYSELEDWDELMQSSNLTNGRLFEVENLINESYSDASYEENKLLLVAEEKTLIEAALSKPASTEDRKATLSYENMDERVSCRMVVKELLNIMVESVECSERLFRSELPDGMNLHEVSSLHANQPSRSTSELDDVLPKASSTVGLNNSTCSPRDLSHQNPTDFNSDKIISDITLEMATAQSSSWTADRILLVEESRKHTLNVYLQL